MSSDDGSDALSTRDEIEDRIEVPEQLSPPAVNTTDRNDGIGDSSSTSSDSEHMASSDRFLVPSTPNRNIRDGMSMSEVPATPGVSDRITQEVMATPSTMNHEEVPSTPQFFNSSNRSVADSYAASFNYGGSVANRRNNYDNMNEENSVNSNMDPALQRQVQQVDLQIQEELTVIRGTDIHVQSAAEAFKQFIQTFVSLEYSKKEIKRQRREAKRINQRRAAGRAGERMVGDNSESDDHSTNSLSSYDSVLDDNDDDEQIPFYMLKLRDILLRTNLLDDNADASETIASTAVQTTAFLDLDTQHLYYHSPECQRLYNHLISYPAEIIPLMDLVLGRILEALLYDLHQEARESSSPNNYQFLQPLSTPVPRVQVRPFHLKSLSHMRALDPHSIDSLLSIRGMVVRTSSIIPDLKVAHFSCFLCAFTTTVTLERGKISEPSVCQSCNTKSSFQLIHNRSLFADKQMVRIQETPNEVPAGETPASIVLFAYDDLVDSIRPGDRVEVTGVFRAQSRRIHPKISKVKSVYKTYLDVIHFRKITGNPISNSTTDNPDPYEHAEGKGIASDTSDGVLSAERIEKLIQLSKSPDIYDQLVKSVAPSIWELDDVKKGVLCMLFGGNSRRVPKGTAEKERKKMENGDDSSTDEDDNEDRDGDENGEESSSKLNKRGDINILLCGDPGTSKSQLLSYVHKLSPRGVYTSGKGSSAVGLTASVVRDPETRDLVLESGALVLSDLGICCIDEFDKMSDTTRAILHEAMEQQTVSIAKAGIIATLNARTSILASANPVESRYNPKLSVVDNIKLPPTLLSRFDLIYLILDAPDVESDRRLAQHLVGLYYETPNVIEPPLGNKLLRDYIFYARHHIHPELSDLATRELISAYLQMRHMGSRGGNSRTISATPRQLESLIRLSEALAKMRYSSIVSRADVKEAVRLMRVATQAAATDPRTGRIDMDMITTGRSTASRELEQALNISLRELLAERRGTRMSVSDIRRQLSEIMNTSSLSQNELIEALRRMEADTLIQFNERNQTVFVKASVLS